MIEIKEIFVIAKTGERWISIVDAHRVVRIVYEIQHATRFNTYDEAKQMIIKLFESRITYYRIDKYFTNHNE